MEIKKQTFTPKMAEELLKRNLGNRRFKQRTVDRYAQEMSNGRWMSDTGESIKISSSGNLLDGQHRLLAVIKAGISVDMYVCHGVPTEVFKVLDSGTPRTSSDSFHIKGIPHANILPSIITLYLEVSRGRPDLNIARSTSELLNIYSTDTVFWDDISRRTSAWYLEFGRILSPSIIGGTYTLFLQKNTIDAQAFMKQLCSGMDISSRSLGMLRKRLIDDKISNSKMTNRLKISLIIKAWNLFRKRDNSRMLKFDADKEGFPIAI